MSQSTGVGSANDEPVSNEVGRRDRRWALTGGAAILFVALLAAAASYLGPKMRSPQQAAADAAPPQASIVTATAEQRVLSEPVVLRGTVKPGSGVKLTVPPSLIGPEAVVTAVFMAPGQRVQEGSKIIECSGLPVVALALPFPLYRDIASGSTGPDVLELQRALRRLGYSVSTNSTLDSATEKALTTWWRKLGYTLTQAGGQASTQGRAKTDGQAGSGHAGGESDGTAAGKPDSAAAASEPGQAQPAAGVQLPRSAILQLPTPGTVSSVGVHRGDILNDAKSPLAELDGGAPTLQATAARDQVGLLTVGRTATALDEVSGQRAGVAIETVGTAVQTDAATGTAGFPIGFRFTGTAMEPAERSVRVDIATAANDKPVLAVPVSAIYSRPDGTTYVTVVADGKVPAEITVVSGQTGGGWTEIRPTPESAVAAGTKVMVGTR